MGDAKESMPAGQIDPRERCRRQIATVAERARRTGEALDRLLEESDKLSDGSIVLIAGLLSGELPFG